MDIELSEGDISDMAPEAVLRIYNKVRSERKEARERVTELGDALSSAQSELSEGLSALQTANETIHQKNAALAAVAERLINTGVLSIMSPNLQKQE